MTASPLATHWTLDPSVIFLNHGSFGACPRAVLERQSELRARLEAEPVRFLLRELEPLMDEALAALGAFIGADPADLAVVPNASTGVNAVLRSLRFSPGDEILTTDHGYGACLNAAHWVASRAGAKVVIAQVPFPLSDEQEVVSEILSRATNSTRLALLDHVTSPTGLIFPLARLVAALADRGIDTLVDGAHAPGMLPLDLRALGAAYYTGNCHKWLCAPKGAAFLYVRRDRQSEIVPTTISHGLTADTTRRSRFQCLFAWTGTSDPSAFLCVPEAIKVVGSLVPGGWPEVRARNHSLALLGRDRLCAALQVSPPAPDDMLGSLAAVPIAVSAETPPGAVFDPLQDALWREERIEVPVFAWGTPPRRLIRVAAHLYNSAEQMETLAAALSRRVLQP